MMLVPKMSAWAMTWRRSRTAGEAYSRQSGGRGGGKEGGGVQPGRIAAEVEPGHGGQPAARDGVAGRAARKGDGEGVGLLIMRTILIII
ncbi:hypothetical protein E0493_20440 [Roseomonas sp. M0104]|uniref:Uncharacterized protein n=1 Tax=Teichococcus coralli TaxID=2545983 RepID=A0A845BDR0_9PROT|nr:hypothetical protein [Pseudoroseomonas coralli]MXP65723.1 hypothetical protein [Pseudoroseomonas coralli]